MSNPTPPEEQLRRELRYTNGMPIGSVHVGIKHPLPLTKEGEMPASVTLTSKKGLEWAQYYSKEETERQVAAAKREAVKDFFRNRTIDGEGRMIVTVEEVDEYLARTQSQEGE